MSASKAVVKIFRFDPTVDREPRYETYEVPPEAWNNRKVIDVLRYIYENFAPGLAYREVCYQRLCGVCTIRVNNKPVLACDAIATQEMVIEPATKGQVLKDLVVFSPRKSNRG